MAGLGLAGPIHPACRPLLAQTMNPRYYNPGTPALTDIWVDPLNGTTAIPARIAARPCAV